MPALLKLLNLISDKLGDFTGTVREEDSPAMGEVGADLWLQCCAGMEGQGVLPTPRSTLGIFWRGLVLDVHTS